MKRLELTISPEYVLTWGLWEALRELQQNSIDQEKIDPHSKMIHLYEAENSRLIIGNEFSKLSKRSLLLGETTKRDNKDLIGQYGEGYKLAMLILIRLGYKLTIFNQNEIWHPKIIQSKRFEGDLLVIDIEETNRKNDHLIFYVEEISATQYKEFQNNCLSFQEVGETIECQEGEILLNPKYAGKVFVEGLFVCKYDPKEIKIKYGYNMKAQFLPLDRDRMKVSSFDLFYLTSSIYRKLPIEHASIVFELIEENYEDTSWFLQGDFESAAKNYPICSLLGEMKFNKFKENFGENAIPCKTQQEYDYIQKEHPDSRPVLVDINDYQYFCHISEVKSVVKKVKEQQTPQELMKEFLNSYRNYLSGNGQKDLEHLVELSESWEWKR